MKTFEDGAEGADEMVVVKDIPFYTHCEHHMAPFFGTATIAYLPDKKIVGLSKLNRVLDAYARRLQVQERLTCQVADAIMNNLSPLGCGVVIKARHLCMESRGVCQQGHHTITSALRGLFKEESAVRSEFMALAR
jgi:GTP cyclohydrolase I